ncbi:hypothetical protein VCHA50P415_10326 [Vibrio chagasii]|nr:hypothetical protein VCHA34P131_10227 [Vibrio chagasii]CAH6848329.1 hypothetical protein VCHA29O37_10311 [Vibrio chagasii]CAH6848596.1 hypothetical protein VCHA35P150_10225 [Vibrio chagasii]CAH6848634.1 hypothetical protein VCHA37O173_10312 [Vibrio chagasii]CAH6849126.1 hypothetical protein VCHA36O157_10546 [Vibrio chagasii]
MNNNAEPLKLNKQAQEKKPPLNSVVAFRLLTHSLTAQDKSGCAD